MKNLAESISMAIAENDVKNLEEILNQKDHNFDIDTLIEHESWTSLHLAVKLGNADQVKLLLEKGANVNLKSRHGNACLHLAIKKDNIGLMKLFLKKINVSEAKCTPIYLAVMKKEREIVQLLLNNKADVDAQDAGGNSPLHLAADRQSIPLITLLLSRGADTNLKNSDGDTPFHKSFKLNSDHVLDCFLRCGANVELKDKSGRNALHLAVTYVTNRSSTAVQSLVCRRGNVNEVTETTLQTALHLLCKVDADAEKKLSIARTLIENGADVNAIDAFDRTPLEYALLNRGKERKVIEYLLSSNAYVNCQGERSFVYDAIKCQDEDAIKRFVDYYVENTVYSRRETSLLFRTLQISNAKLRYDIVRFLLDSGWDVGERSDFDGSTALHRSIEKRDLHLLALFVEFGADVRVEDQIKRESPLHKAVRLDFYEAAEILLSRLGGIDETFGEICQRINVVGSHSLLAAAINNKNRRMTELLLDNGANVNDLLAWKTIARTGSVELMQLLESRGGKVYLPKSELGGAMFVEAIAHAKHPMVKLLLDRGADVNRTYYRLLPLQHLTRAADRSNASDDYRRFSIAKLLVKYVAVLAARNVRVHEGNASVIKSNAAMLREFEACSAELERMKRTRVCEKLGVTYFDVLTTGENGLVNHLRFRRFSDEFDLTTRVRSFANYHAIVEGKYLRASARLRKLNEFETAIKRIFCDTLPDCVARAISEYYNDRDFANCFST